MWPHMPGGQQEQFWDLPLQDSVVHGNGPLHSVCGIIIVVQNLTVLL